MPEPKVALVIGAGDSTGGAVARRFAREGFFTCVTRRHADKLASLVAANRGRRRKGPRLRQRRATRGCGDRAVRNHRTRDRSDRSRIVQRRRQCPLSRSAKPPPASIPRCGSSPRWRAFSPGARPPRSWCRAGAAPSCSPAPPPACGAGSDMQPSPAPSTRFGRWRKAWRVNLAREVIHVAHVVVDGAIDTEVDPAAGSRIVTNPGKPRTASSILTRSRRITGCCTASRAMPGRTNSTCARGRRPGDGGTA